MLKQMNGVPLLSLLQQALAALMQCLLEVIPGWLVKSSLLSSRQVQ